MAIYIKGKTAAPNIVNHQKTDFTKVTAHEEFVAKGKTFFDETGKLKTGKAIFAGQSAEVNLIEGTAKENGTYYPSNDGGDGYSKFTVAVPTNGEAPVLQEKPATPTKSTQTITPDSGYDGLSKVIVNPIPDEYITPSGTLPITTNGTHDVTNYSAVSVNVPTETGGGSSIETVAVTIVDDSNLFNTVNVSYIGLDDSGNPVSKSVNVVHTDWYGSIDVVKGTDLIIENTTDGYTIGYDSQSGFTSVDYAGDQVLICRVGDVACEITPSQIESTSGGGSAPTIVQMTGYNNTGENLIVHYLGYENGALVYKCDTFTAAESEKTFYCVDQSVTYIQGKSGMGCDYYGGKMYCLGSGDGYYAFKMDDSLDTNEAAFDFS